MEAVRVDDPDDDDDDGGEGAAGRVLFLAELRRVLVEANAREMVRVTDALAMIQCGLAQLADVDPELLDTGECRAWLEGIEAARRGIEATAIAAAGHVDRHEPFHEQGFFTAKTALKHILSLSGSEAYRRVQTARMHDRLGDWADAELDGDVGVAQTELMGKVAANPGVPRHILERDQHMLLDDARTLPYDRFELAVRTWESLADPDGERARNLAQHARRDVMLRARPEGGWTLTGNLPELAGAEFMAIFSHYIEAEWEQDWADARARLGDTATTADLIRTEPQRRADALVAMARDAASALPGIRRPAITVNILFDADSFEARLTGRHQDPADYRDIVCRTRDGRRINSDDAANTALIAEIRRVVHDTSRTVIELGRRSRLFRGSSRESVMLLETCCAWIGCDRPVDWCQADHSTGWKAHGATVPRNGAPLCGQHNRLKERGYQVFRDNTGNWHTIDPHGNEIT